jgi:hypothetical protein
MSGHQPRKTHGTIKTTSHRNLSVKKVFHSDETIIFIDKHFDEKGRPAKLSLNGAVCANL